MKQFWRWLGALAITGVIWAMCEYGSVTVAVVTLAGMVAVLDVNMKERFDQIGKALEMQSKKVFPELWD
ncbi:hypothetical protein [Ensifer aridi]|uniref:hypothetical protein n=1 Tax=Ensifer aridi TaxID=1708715 RepID=UPI00358E6C7D